MYDRSFQSGQDKFFGKADIGDVGNPVFSESIKMVATHSAYPANNPDDARTDLIETRKGEIIMVTYNQQSVDMSLYAGALKLANHGTTERIATKNYNGGDDVEAYANIVEGYLKDQLCELRLKKNGEKKDSRNNSVCFFANCNNFIYYTYTI